jgi:hypothetical protein
MPASATTATATGTFEVSAMEEDTYQQLEGVAKLTHARGKQRLSGDLTGEGTVEWLMCYRVDGLAHYVGLQTGRRLSSRSVRILRDRGAWQLRWGGVEGHMVGDSRIGQRSPCRPARRRQLRGTRWAEGIVRP